MTGTTYYVTAGSTIITNVYLSTLNRWTGAWPTASSYLAVGACRDVVPTIDDNDDDGDAVLKTEKRFLSEARLNSCFERRQVIYAFSLFFSFCQHHASERTTV